LGRAGTFRIHGGGAGFALAGVARESASLRRRDARPAHAIFPRNLLDLIFAALPVERELIARGQPKSLGGKSIKVAAVEDLIWIKLISKRSKDVEDARRLIRRFRRTLDRAYLEPRLVELSEAFARQDVLDIFRAEMERA
jgi:hypothetical protein